MQLVLAMASEMVDKSNHSNRNGATEMPDNLVEKLRQASGDPGIVAQAQAAAVMVAGWLGVDRLRHMNSGSDTGARMLARIAGGMTTEQAAAAEYRYRWHLPLNQWVNHAETDKPRCRHSSRRCTGAWHVPHLIGM